MSHRPLRRFVFSFAAAAFLPLLQAQQSNLDEFKNNLAPYVIAPTHAVDRMLEMANPKPGEVLYDLGCGEGSILIKAAQKYNVKAVGIEISGHLAQAAAEKVRKNVFSAPTPGSFPTITLSRAGRRSIRRKAAGARARLI